MAQELAISGPNHEISGPKSPVHLRQSPGNLLESPVLVRCAYFLRVRSAELANQDSFCKKLGFLHPYLVFLYFLRVGLLR